MNILFAVPEMVPFIKVGGLADVAGALPAALRRLGHDVRVVLPRYRQVRTSAVPQAGPIAACFLPVGDRQEPLRIFTASHTTVPVYLLDIPAAFDRDAIYGYEDDDARFILFARGVLALILHLQTLEGWRPDVVHAHDWPAALLPNYLKTIYAGALPGIATVYTIHNLGYQGVFSPFTLHLSGLGGQGEVETLAGPAFAGQFNFMARGIIFADVVSTVSPTYAREILTPAYGEGLDGLLRRRRDHLVGILNGIDVQVFNPATDPYIAANYSADDLSGKAICKAALQRECGFAEEPCRPLLGMVSRLAPQKGLDLLHMAMPWLIGRTDAHLVILGTGQPELEQAFAAHMRAHPDRVNVQLRFDAPLAQRIYAGCDAFLMPSRYEPCGLTQLIALRYGSVPVVRATGGLNDTIREGPDGNGFRFGPYEPHALIEAIGRCLAAYRDREGWAALRMRGMREDHSWEAAAREYVALYTWARKEIGG
jgi:starch synthase